MSSNLAVSAILYVLNRDMPKKIRWVHHDWEFKATRVNKDGHRLMMTVWYGNSGTVKQYEAVTVGRNISDFEFNIETEMGGLAKELNKRIEIAMKTPILNTKTKLTGDDT